MNNPNKKRKIVVEKEMASSNKRFARLRGQ
jgi:hypothetical protein